MPKGVPNKRYTGEFKQKVVEIMQKEKLSYKETAREFDIPNGDRTVAKWERIYLEEGPEGLYIERRGRASASGVTKKGRPPKLDRKVEEDLIAEVQRLRAENAYLKKLNALVTERVRQEKKHK
ncbi:MAG: helix-turn-helix domain-containing protein [Faecalibacterium sp.]|nr:helix-turn-helix domain-containing protein [Ruminococcus sp.]MCM1393113.1 helix-turn-helix domain-containing protein [Ruminococcus sp.]MCM1486604.1 helix-turn-helix domain-containing protein [Faecalibacterium sp.]